MRHLHSARVCVCALSLVIWVRSKNFSSPFKLVLCSRKLLSNNPKAKTTTSLLNAKEPTNWCNNKPVKAAWNYLEISNRKVYTQMWFKLVFTLQAPKNPTSCSQIEVVMTPRVARNETEWATKTVRARILFRRGGGGGGGDTAGEGREGKAS